MRDTDNPTQTAKRLRWAGGILLLLAALAALPLPLLSQWQQFQELQLTGSALTNPAEYLVAYPCVVYLILAAGLLVAGICCLAIAREKK